MKIIVIGALQIEIEHLIKKTQALLTDKIFDLDLYKSTIGKHDVFIMQCSVGKVNAAICTQKAIQMLKPDFIMNTGIAGSLRPDNKIGTIIIGSEITYHDVRPSQMQRFFPYTEVFSSDSAAVQQIYQCTKDNFDNIDIKIGKIVTGDTFIDKAALKQGIYARYHADCVDMESAAIAHTCYVHSIPFVCVRTICDNADENSIIEYQTFEKSSAIINSKIIYTFLMTSE